MITVINATNRPDNKTRVVVDAYVKLLDESGLETRVFDMAELPPDFIFSSSYGKRTPHMDRIIKERIDEADRFVIIAPEYNGSFPGVFKAFIDSVHPKHFHGKKAALVGVSTGRAGNLRGMDHLTDVMHHLGVEVLSNKVPLSRLDDLITQPGTFDHEDSLQTLRRQIRRFLKF